MGKRAEQPQRLLILLPGSFRLTELEKRSRQAHRDGTEIELRLQVVRAAGAYRAQELLARCILERRRANLALVLQRFTHPHMENTLKSAHERVCDGSPATAPSVLRR